jgi:hypothetical protein
VRGLVRLAGGMQGVINAREAAELASARRRSPTANTRCAPAREDANWPDWYAAYMVAEQAETELPT